MGMTHDFTFTPPHPTPFVRPLPPLPHKLKFSQYTEVKIHAMNKTLREKVVQNVPCHVNAAAILPRCAVLVG